ncbi:hypothetical protein [Sulfurimonas sp. RIFOXYB12_FULL_35_9]|uniref:hypothetical protein n=1 Tax=Sulfurimonas sp. RIFOXYB12_FULL_35_9 TaxID=1802256 RepID=UPI0008C8BFC2|nr:hypothetical protein [Sulfurimonas sp. RIFOXYB12_FULL_35_9]OHE05047.1 MAG: hypothetical protein A2345_06765 [Sulfurimonas sp. RIFOXYB12_FULL_35_9]
MTILNNLINILFKNKQTIITYKDEYKEAIRRTKRLKLKLPNVDINDEIFLNKKFKEAFDGVINKYSFQTKDLYLRCYDFNYNIKKVLDNQLEYNFMYTIGYIEIDGEPYFKSTEEDLLKMIKHEQADYNLDGIKIHVWLTLPSMEIIDFTLSTTLNNIFSNIPKGGVIMRHADANNYIKYKPLLIGDDFFKKIKVF